MDRTLDKTPHITVEQYLALKKKKKKNKFSAEKQHTMNGVKCDSKAEASLGTALELMEKAKEIEDLQYHTRIEIMPGFYWRVDFNAIDLKSGVREYHEFKGVESHGYRLQKAAWKLLGPGPLHIYKGEADYYRLVETVIPNVQSFKDWLLQNR